MCVSSVLAQERVQGGQGCGRSGNEERPRMWGGVKPRKTFYGVVRPRTTGIACLLVP